ncbi:LysR family transcriptional regulator [Salibacterium qingdaonense]|uniref:DNA-binding transcriptional regulator, LysR family n=1 Tax=Salibacterium qingdaonense TaxID=266892 RepID=A0A1I4P2A3_9BACI|nr:LysR family transcriptional regulator [Salibacterium qingdaonense]SFM21670.1 DNA-binding transcriptional regulator, LysR family [Salibacterium qingdaonense]
MDIKQLQYFIEINRFNSFSKAAEHLYVTQPTISKMIKNLEKEFNVTLFDRSKKQVVLTDAGNIILEQAQVIHQAFKDLESQLEDLSGLKQGRLRIGLPPMVGSSYFPMIIGKFREMYPAVTIELMEDGSNKIAADVENGHLDLGVVVEPVKEDVFSYFSFGTEPIQLVAAADHPLAGRDSVPLSELKNEHFMLLNSDFALRNRIMEACRMEGFDPFVVFESSQWDLLGKMAASKLGVTLLPESICREVKGEVCIKDVDQEAMYWRLAIIWRRDSYLSHAAKEWIRFAETHLPDEGPIS